MPRSHYKNTPNMNYQASAFYQKITKPVQVLANEDYIHGLNMYLIHGVPLLGGVDSLE